jgi:uncharacterized protein YcbK (DUF882 family)
MHALLLVACGVLELTNTHTNEVVRVTRDTFAQFDHVLRDHRTGEQFTIDRALYDLLVDLAAAAGREPQYEIISGYRSPQTNAKLASRPGSGVSSRSLHMQGRAIDVRLKDFPTAKLRDLALAMKRGGVGYYPTSDFVHLDTGRVRSWAGK